MTDDTTKRRILARRAQLVAAAISAVACSPEPKPAPCLEAIVLPPEDAGAAVIPPEPCLQPVQPPEPADASVTATDSPKDSGVKPIVPSVCLSPMPPPKVCLKPMPPPTVCLYIKK